MEMDEKEIALLRAKIEAARLHEMLGMRKSVESGEGRIDVFEAIRRCGTELIFRRLDRICGAYLEHPVPGILISTGRRLCVQRFTAARALGHVRLNHRSVHDVASESIPEIDPSASQQMTLEENQVSTFANEFMVPDWLISTWFTRYDWDKQKLLNPRVLYQLSLRVGIAYKTLCIALTRPGVGILDKSDASRLISVKPRKIKQQLLQDNGLASINGDVWELTSKDEGTLIEGNWSDIFLLKLDEHSSSGYIWNFDQMNESGFAVVRDNRDTENQELVGGVVKRSIVMKSSERQTGELILNESRPWLSEYDPKKILCSMKFKYDLSGPHPVGWGEPELDLVGG